MKYSPEHNTGELQSETAGLLDELRERRNFDADVYIEAKTKYLNDYMREANLKSCVVAISGGIDSALALALVHEAAQQPDSPIENIYPLSLPVHHDDFTKNQDTTLERGRELCEALDMGLIEIDLTETYDAMKKAVDTAIGVEGEPWAAGQLVAYLRTPANYYTTSLTTQLGGTGIVCGTTNRDEGAYLGYVGKASDGIVDVQLISDLHKSEVRALSQRLGVPQSILDAQPTGDMYDGRIDEEVFGTTYDYVELFLLLKSLDEREANSLLSRLDPTERQAFETARTNLEELHSYNAHKYRVGSPAAHLDVMESGVPGGWQYSRQKVSRKPEGTDKFVNPFEVSQQTIEAIYEDLANLPSLETSLIDLPKGEALVVQNAASKGVLKALLADADLHGWQPVGIDGFAHNYKEGDEIGSWRATTFSPELSDYVWSRVSRFLSNPQVMDKDPQVDVEPGSIWRPLGISPLMRLIGYRTDGRLIPHYDAPFTYSEDMMTLKSLVLYADAAHIAGGSTRFLHDDRLRIPIAKRDLDDRTDFAKPEDVREKVNPEVGSALIFDHRLLHDAEPVTALDEDGRKVIVRTDVVYAKC